MTRIVKIFTGRHIDLDKVVSISDAQFVDKMGSGGWFVSFTIDFQLMDEPINYIRRLDEDEYVFDGEHKLVVPNAPLVSGWDITPEIAAKSVAVQKLQRQIDEVVSLWRGDVAIQRSEEGAFKAGFVAGWEAQSSGRMNATEDEMKDAWEEFERVLK